MAGRTSPLTRALTAALTRALGGAPAAALTRAFGGALAAALAVGAAQAAPETGFASVEALVRASYYEGIPYEQARAVDAEAAAHLIEMLADPNERPHHAAILEVLGISARPGAYEAIERYARRTPTGEVDAETHRARIALCYALGHLARSDERALHELLARARSNAASPDWRHGRHFGERLRDHLRRCAITGLALSGRAEAGAVLRQLAGADARAQGTDAVPENVERHAGSLLGLHQRIAAEGADRVLGGVR